MNNMTNTLLTNFTSTVSINSDDEKVRYKINCIFHTFSLVIILIFIIAIICYHKSSISCIVSHNHTKIKIDSDDNLPIEKSLTFHNVVILLQSK